MTHTDLLRQALDALGTCTPGDYSTGTIIPPCFDEKLVSAAYDALRARLAQQDAEPVAWMRERWEPDCGTYTEIYTEAEMTWRDRKEWRPLYATPQAQPVPVPADTAALIQRVRDAAHWQLIEGNGDDEQHRTLNAAADGLESLSTAPAVPVVPDGLRPEIVAFARLMERELRNNDHKGGWKDEAPGRLLEHAHKEMRELVAAFLAYPRDTREYHDNLASEGADVANMVLMVLDVCGALAAAPAVPDGWVMVPREPSIAMCIAGDGARHNVDDATRTPAIYRAMIAAAPESAPAAPAVREPDMRTFDVDPDCNYYAPTGKLCDKCGRIHRGITGHSK